MDKINLGTINGKPITQELLMHIAVYSAYFVEPNRALQDDIFVGHLPLG